ncbi:MAG: hypothetical protein R2854_30165 [Caldilineaceae bacterium]
MLTPFRAMLEEQRDRDREAAMARTLVKRTLPYPERFRLAVRMGKLTRGLHRLPCPAPCAPCSTWCRRTCPWRPRLPEVVPARGHGAPGLRCWLVRPTSARARHQLVHRAGAGAQRCGSGDPARAGLLRFPFPCTSASRSRLGNWPG